mmetsp:Transcript_94728/g.251599  ORF Transcript_94728/g.251599 Transcript_94728/m.251599 type:complete len:222 (+) Transcript_94728:359-1024(+)
MDRRPGSAAEDAGVSGHHPRGRWHGWAGRQHHRPQDWKEGPELLAEAPQAVHARADAAPAPPHAHRRLLDAGGRAVPDGQVHGEGLRLRGVPRKDRRADAQGGAGPLGPGAPPARGQARLAQRRRLVLGRPARAALAPRAHLRRRPRVALEGAELRPGVARRSRRRALLRARLLSRAAGLAWPSKVPRYVQELHAKAGVGALLPARSPSWPARRCDRELHA